MNVQINQLVKTLLQKDSLEQCSLQELRQYADRHPYFGAAQLLLTKKLQAENSEQYNEQLQKTFLFFHNPLWVQQLLNETGHAEIIAAPVKENVHTIEINAPVISLNESVKSEETITEIKRSEELKADEPIVQFAEIKPEPVAEAKSELLFEPYHTVDYFASQGIKFKEEEKPKDKFGLQLKSFTEWLKTMKRLPVSEIAASVDSTTEKKVEQLAETSLQERHIVTETMAEVWEKQGNHQKAIEVYSKLSLLEPSKSTYFAAKIEELKKRV
ncbi:MAG: hypothetical protein HZB42_05705 [Sphingobacteriales bacterium]|nr:hypothetical protein [Sphingobacteriales bacterium]